MLNFLPEFSQPVWVLVLSTLVAYALGSIPFGLVMAKLFGLGDIRQIGSGNIGATNVLRTGSKTAAFLTLICDAGKAGMVVLLAGHFLSEDAAQMAGFAAFFGHCYPLWLGFKGGKGVATFYGLVFALAWPLGIITGMIWLIVVALCRYVSLGSIICAALLPFVAMWMGYSDLVGLGVALAGLILWRHYENIARLRHGTEHKIGHK